MRSLLALSVLLALTANALAAPDCEDLGPGLHISFGVRVGAPYTEEEQEIFDKMYLRQNGIIARETKRTARGCIEAWVPDGKGGFSTEYFDPRSFRHLTFDENTFQLQLD